MAAKRNRFQALAVAATALSVSGGSASAAPSVTMMADSCAVCHGSDGRSVSKIDSLAGMSVREFIEEMNEMKTDPHEGRLMGIVAKGFSMQEVQALGRYFQALSPGKGKKDDKKKKERHAD